MTEEDQSLSRPQRRALRRIYNGRTVPIIAEGRPFLSFKEASHYLQSLAPEARDAAFAAMMEQAKQPAHKPPATTLDNAPQPILCCVPDPIEGA